MRAAAGQAARHTGRLLHFLAQLALALTILLAAGVGGVCWRLAQGPLDLPWLARRLEAAANADQSARLSLGSAALAWEGFSAGSDQPLDIRLADLVFADAHGQRVASIPRADVTLSVGALLRGQLAPRSVALSGARLRLARAQDGSVTVDLGGLAATEADAADADSGVPAEMLRELSRPPRTDAAAARTTRWSQLRRLRVRDAAIVLVDRARGMRWRMPELDIDARRPADGGMVAQARARLQAGEVASQLSVQAVLHGDTGQTDLSAQLGEIVPAALAASVPGAGPLAALDAPVTLSASATLDRALRPIALRGHAALGAGRLAMGGGHLPILGATLDADGTPERMRVTLGRLDLAAHPDAPPTQVTAEADIARAPDGAISARGRLGLDRVAFADLPGLWPPGIGGPGTRPWITQNITAGMAHDGHAAFALTAPADLSDATLTELTGGIVGDDATIHWLRPVPPIERAAAVLTMVGPDRFDIAVSAGRQAGGSKGGLQIHGGRVTLTGLAAKDQFADIEADLAGPVPDLLALLRDPKVKLLDRSPLKLRDAAGQLAGHVSVSRLALKDSVTMDDVNIRASAKLAGLRLAGIAGGRDLERGAISLDANPDGLRAAGSAQVAGIDTQMQLEIDFRAGPPGQVTQKLSASATLGAAQLAALGVDAQGAFSGSADLSAAMSTRRNGRAEIALHGDLRRAGLSLDTLGVDKPASAPGTLDLRLLLAGERLEAVDRIRLDADGLHVGGRVAFAEGRPDTIHLEQAMLGQTTDAHGAIRPPRRPGDPWVISLSGPSLDVSRLLAAKDNPAPAGGKPDPGPPFLLDAAFDRVVLGPGRALAGVNADVVREGGALRIVRLSGQTPAVGDGAPAPFSIEIAPQRDGRRLTATAQDTGALLRAFDVISTIQGGRLAATASFDDTRPERPLSGNLRIDTFRVRDAPIFGRLLKAMTLYGLVDVLSGPGLGFTRLEAPFRFADGRLELAEARAFSASLGMTAKGSVDLGRRMLDLKGTIVPAYFFNALLGKIPLIGRLFSPERGGGLFAATYAVHGDLDDPSIGVNPLAALTPGVLRKLFGIFDASR